MNNSYSTKLIYWTLIIFKALRFYWQQFDFVMFQIPDYNEFSAYTVDDYEEFM